MSFYIQKRIIQTAAALMTCAVMALTGCGDNKQTVETPDPTPDITVSAQTPEVILPEPTPEPSAVKIGTDIPITRAQVAKMLAFVMFDRVTIETTDREIDFVDTDTGLWYDKYINAVYLAGIMKGGDGYFNPDGYLTLIQAQYLLDVLAPDNDIDTVPNDDMRETPIAYASWVSYFQEVLDIMGDGDAESQFGITKASFIPLTAGSGTVTADTGQLYCAGVSMENYIDKEITVLKKDGEIIALLTLDNTAPTIRNAYITAKNENSVTIFSGGALRTYAYAGIVPDGSVCDITVSDGEALWVTVYNEKMTGTVKRITQAFTELRDIGVVPNDDMVKIYGVSGSSATWKSIGSVIVGSDIAEFVIYNGTIRAILIKETATLENIRVCISATDYTGYLHEIVSLTADTAYTVWAGGSALTFAAGDIFTVSVYENDNLFGNPRIYITVNEEGGRIQLRSVKRSWPGDESPWYRGFMEIALEADGRFTIVNEVPIEEYLYAVVPSEMPTSHGLEAAKVQAVTARSYAYTQYYANSYHRYGANIDDSVMCQVYNNIPENETSMAACDETAGYCLAYNGTVIAANFFSTSAGVTANSGEVWANSSTRQFPTANTPYLTSARQYTAGDYGDLSNESNASAFFKDLNVQGYDSAFPWFRWNVTMTADQLSASINAALATRYAANPALIKTLQPNGVYRSRPISSIGQFTDMEVLSRGEGGIVTALRISGTEATILVYTELNIRYILRPAAVGGGSDIVVNRLNSGGVNNFSLLPSAFMVFDKTYGSQGEVSSVTFYGGGYGHGVGMSQNGVKGMIDAGFTFGQILRHYYPGTVLIKKW